MAKKRTRAQRSAAAKASWQLRKLKSAKAPAKASRSDKVSFELVQSPTEEFFGLTPGYAALHRELMEAYTQSAEGKGKERHANGKPFDRQPIMELSRLYGPGFAAGQSAKKVQEALGMLSRGEREKAIHEVHGGIVYLAALANLLRETP